MLEVKDKNLSALKANLAVQCPGQMKDLEKEWARYKYAVLAHSQKHYQAVRSLLKDKSSYPVREFYSLIEEALDIQPEKSVEINALDHIWGHVRKQATGKEKERYLVMKEEWLADQIKISRLKNWLKRLAAKYEEDYLLQSLYFDLD